MSDDEWYIASDSDDERVAIAFDVIQWAETMAALKNYKRTLDASKHGSSLLDVTNIMRRIDEVMTA